MNGVCRNCYREMMAYAVNPTKFSQLDTTEATRCLDFTELSELVITSCLNMMLASVMNLFICWLDLQFSWFHLSDQVKSALPTAIALWRRSPVRLFLAAFTHYCTDPDVIWGALVWLVWHQTQNVSRTDVLALWPVEVNQLENHGWHVHPSSFTLCIRGVGCHSNQTSAPVANPPNSAQLWEPQTIPQVTSGSV